MSERGTSVSTTKMSDHPTVMNHTSSRAADSLSGRLAVWFDHLFFQISLPLRCHVSQFGGLEKETPASSSTSFHIPFRCSTCGCLGSWTFVLIQTCPLPRWPSTNFRKFWRHTRPKSRTSQDPEPTKTFLFWSFLLPAVWLLSLLDDVIKTLNLKL